jgi:predicted membrane channel-forming protein YqfA (hemolysin III family)
MDSDPYRNRIDAHEDMSGFAVNIIMGEPQQYNHKEFLYRVGTFFLLVGFGLLAFFMLSEAAKQPTFSYFCWSMILFIIGFVFRAQYKKPAGPPSERFSILKKLKPQPREEKKK